MQEAAEHPSIGQRQLSSEEKPRFRDATSPAVVESEKKGGNANDESGSSGDFVVPQNAVDVTKEYSWRKQLQEKMYRTEEEVALRSTFSALLAEPTAGLVLISGPKGSGKTRLAKSLKTHVEELGGYFLTGKFDQLRHPEPYSAFVAAFAELTSLVTARGASAALKMRDSINQVVGNEASTLTSMIPALESILGPTNEQSDESNVAANADAIQRFVSVFRSFIRAICSPTQPIVLLMDDLQYADRCSLDLLSSIATDTQNKGLVVIGTCDDNVSSDSYLSSKLREMEDKEGARITDIAVGNLGESEVNSLIAFALQLDVKSSENLGKIVSLQTNGNMFYIYEFLRWLQDSDLLRLDGATRSWSWDEEEIKMTINICQVGEFLVDKLEQLPKSTKDTLKVAACLGSHVDEGLIEKVLGIPVGNVLDEAVAMGILIRDEARGCYAFEHDDLQEAAYHLIPENEKEQFHLEVGRRMWRKFDSDELDRNLFILLSQMKVGRRLITREKERIAVATLCLHGGRKAARSSTFRMASIYLELGISLLGARGWRDEYGLTLALHNAAAEMEICVANFERMEELLQEVFEHAKTFDDKFQAYATKIYALGVSGRQQEAIDTGVHVLKQLGEQFPSRLCKAHLMSEMKSVMKLLRGKSDEQLLRMAIITDGEKIACMRIFHLIFFNAMMTRPKLLPFIVIRSMKLTMQHGMSVFAPSAFAGYGMLCITAANDFDSGYRYGELGLKLLERFKAIEYLPRVYAAFYGIIYAWKKPLRNVMGKLLYAKRVGMQTGDFQGACLCANLYCISGLESGVPLDIIEREWRGFRETMVSSRQESLLAMAKNPVRAVHQYMGLAEDSLLAKEKDLLLDAQEEGGMVPLLRRYCQMIVAYTFNRYDLAWQLADGLRYLWMVPPTVSKVNVIFVGGMVALACVRERKNVRKNMRTARKTIKELKIYATQSPHNYLGRRFLLEAELASVQGQNKKAYEKYICAISLAKDSGVVNLAALANERVGYHLFGIGERAAARPFFENACGFYCEWGGKAKAKQLEARVEAMYSMSGTEQGGSSAVSGSLPGNR